MVAEQTPTTFQQTEAGLIPSDWEVSELGRLIKLISGQHILSQNYNYESIGVPYLTGPADFGLTYPCISKWTRYPKSEAIKNDTLITVKGDGVGKINLLNINKAAISRQLMAIRPQHINGSYLYQYLRGRYDYFQELSSGSTVPGLSRNDISNTPIPVPPTLAEQMAIATALSDADALISQLEKLTTKKIATKQGAMQELLRPKEGWEEKTLGEVAPLQRGFDLPNRLRVNGIYPVVYSNGVLNHHHKFMVKGPGIVTGRSGTIGKINYIEEDFWPHNTSLWVKQFIDSDPKFIYYLFIHSNFKQFASGSGVPTLNRNDLHGLTLYIPLLQEQTRIAQILSDMDAGIEKLEQQLAKQRQIKQGMMQALLTGKIRLV